MLSLPRLLTVILPLVGLASWGPMSRSLTAQESPAGGSLVIQDSPPAATTPAPTTPAATTPAATTPAPTTPAPTTPAPTTPAPTPPAATPPAATPPAATPPAAAPTTDPEPVSIAPVIAPLKLDIARRDLKNFLTDPEALTAYRGPDGLTDSLPEVFVIGSNAVPRAVFWDPLACRLLGVLDLEAPVPPATAPVVAPASNDVEQENAPVESETPEAPAPPSPYLLLAAGPAPLTGSGGAGGAPRYFGFRLVGGMPEFLYTFGLLTVEERLWLEEEGTVLKQRFSVRDARRGIQLTLPEEWRRRATASVGTWKKNVLSVPNESTGEVILTYRLTEVAPEPADSN